MKLRKISWYQTGIISLIGIFLLGNRAINKEITRKDLRLIQINMPNLSQNDKYIMGFDLNVVEVLKDSPQITISIDSLQKISPIIREYKQKYETNHVLTVYWKETTKLQQIVALLDTLQIENQRRYAIIPNDTKCMISLYFPKPSKEFFDGNLGSCLSFYYPEPTTTFKENFDMIFKDYVWVWIFFGGLIACTFWKIKRT